MKGFDVLKVKSAVKGHNKFDLSKTHLTTMNFGEIVPLYVEETIPGDKFSVNAEIFSRMAPLVKPTYGKFQFKTCAAFVPYHMLAYDVEAWLAGKNTWEGKTPKSRYINYKELATFLANTTVSTGVTSADTYDWIMYNNVGTINYRKWTKKGKYYVKILNALGYAIPEQANLKSDSAWMTNIGPKKMSALPLLAFFKLYNDYMSQSQRYNTSELSDFLRNVKLDTLVTNEYSNSSGNILSAGLLKLFRNLFLNYENDYFTSAWQQPNNPVNNYEGQTGILVPGGDGIGIVRAPVVDNQLSVEVYSTAEGGDAVNIGQRALDFLKDFDDWVRRNNYSGSRAVQQIYSRFGIKTDDYRSHYADVITTDVMPIQVGDVTATADAAGAPLGDYAGKGIMSGNKGFSYSCSDYGVLLMLGYFTVTPMNSFGFDRRVLRNTPLDYYNPEFDGLGADAISVGELWASPIAPTSGDVFDTDVFGFTERYNSYRYGRDVISGEFRDYHADGDMNCWHTGRNLADLRSAGTLVAQSTAMNTLPQTDSEYNRIFSITDGNEDKFYVTARFKVSAIRPMLSLNQVPRLGEGDTAVPRNGNVIS